MHHEAHSQSSGGCGCGQEMELEALVGPGARPGGVVHFSNWVDVLPAPFGDNRSHVRTITSHTHHHHTEGHRTPTKAMEAAELDSQT